MKRKYESEMEIQMGNCLHKPQLLLSKTELTSTTVEAEKKEEDEALPKEGLEAVIYVKTLSGKTVTICA